MDAPVKSISESDLKRSYKSFCDARERTVLSGHETVQKAITFGQLLTEKRQQVKHGEWEPMLERIGCSSQEASKLIRLSNPAHERDLTDCNSVRQAYYETGILVKPEPLQLTEGAAAGTGEARAEQSYLQPIMKVCQYFAKNPIPETAPIEVKINLLTHFRPFIDFIRKLEEDVAKDAIDKEKSS